MAIALYTRKCSDGSKAVALAVTNNGSLLSIAGGTVKVDGVEHVVPSASYTLTADAHKRLILAHIALKLSDNSVVVNFDEVDVEDDPIVNPVYFPQPDAEYELLHRLISVDIPAQVDDFSGMRVRVFHVQARTRFELQEPLVVPSEPEA
jgi:hypothetical protein